MSAPVVPQALTDAARLRRDGRLHDAVAVVVSALADARATPFDMPFRDRVLLGLALADLYLQTDRQDSARTLLAEEVVFAETVLALIQQDGSPDQVRAATAGCHQLRDRAVQVDLLGRSAPEIEVAEWVVGQPTTLAEQRGRVVMLEFWARSCRSCVAMLPALSDLHDRYHKHGLTILALTRYGPSDDVPIAERAHERDMIRQISADQSLEFAVGIAADGGLQQRYGATGIPTFAIIDRAGIVRLASSIPDKPKMEKLIADLLDEG